MNCFSSGLRAGSADRFLDSLSVSSIRGILKFGLACVLLALCLLPYSARLTQSSQVRQLEQPTSRFLHQIGLRAQVDVLQLSPLHLLVTTNCNPTSQEFLSRQLHSLYNIDEARGEKLLIVRGRVPFTLRDQPLVTALLGLGTLLVALGTCLGLRRWALLPPPPARPWRWPARLLKLSPLLTLGGVAAGFSPLLVPLNLLLLLWWKVRQRAAQPRPVVNGLQEAAILLMSQPPEFSALVFKELDAEEVFQLTKVIPKLEQISPEHKAAVRATFEAHVRRAWPQAGREQITPAMCGSTLRRFYLSRGDSATLCGSFHQASSLRSVLAGLMSLLVIFGCGLGWGLLQSRLSSQAALEADLRRFVQLNPLAVAEIEREGQTRCLVGLGTPDLDSLRPFVGERALALGLDPGLVNCLGIQRNQEFPVRWTLALSLGGILLLGLRRGRRPKAFIPAPVTRRTAPAPEPAVAPPAPAPVVPATSSKPSEAKESKKLLDLLEVDPILFEVGRGLLPLVNPQEGARLMERITPIRRNLAEVLGLPLPSVKFRDNLYLKPNEYVLRVRGTELARGCVEVGRYLAIGPEHKLAYLKGTSTFDPCFGEPGVWVHPEARADAERLGTMVFDSVSVIATHVTKVIKENAAELLSYRSCLELLDRPCVSALSQELSQRGLDRVMIWQVLREMLRQQVSIRDLELILEGLLVDAFAGASLEELVELGRLAVRNGIVRDLCETQWGKPPEPLVVWRVPEELLDLLDGGVEQNCELLEKFHLLAQRMMNAGHQPVVLVDPVYRPALQKLLLSIKNIRVLSLAELTDWVQLSYFRGEGKL